MFIKKLFTLITILLLLGTSIFAQKIISIKPGDNIQEKFDLLKDGGSIRFQDGEYHFNKSLKLEGKKEISIIAQAYSEVSLICDDIYSSVLQIEDCDNVSISGVKLSHQENDDVICKGSVIRTVNSKSIVIENCELSGCGFIGVEAYNTTSLTVIECFIHSNSGSAIYLYRCEDIVINYNEIKNNKSFLMVYEVNNLTLKGNDISNNYDSDEYNPESAKYDPQNPKYDPE